MGGVLRLVQYLGRLLLFLCVPGFTSPRLLHHMGYDDIEDYHDHPCRRSCQDGATPMTCDFDWLVEVYHTLTKACWDCPHDPRSCSRPHCVPADGGLRGIITANRMLPGPSIHVCEGDTIRVRVHNKMEGSQGTSIHWHGMLQEGTPYMDGVTMVTQCAIPAHTSFTYVFNASTVGTHFWHSHAGLQRADGLFGHLVVRQSPTREPHHRRYDFDLPEHTILVNDWWSRNADPSFAQHHHSNGDNKPSSVLINGKGMGVFISSARTGVSSSTPREVFTVQQGFRYRFRVASNGILNCPLRVSIDEHFLEVIASDGSPVEPVVVESFNIFAGERYDFVLTANNTIDNYLLRVQGGLDCGPAFKNAHQTAILHYVGAVEDMELNSSFVSPAPLLKNLVLNPINTGKTNSNLLVSDLRSLKTDDPALTQEPDQQIVLAMDFVVIDNPRFHHSRYYSTRDFLKGNRQLQTTQINGITNMMPSVPALSQMKDIPQELLCDNYTRHRNCSQEFCQCLHLYKVRLGQVVELVLVDQGHIWNASHPTHLHGHGFRVLAQDRVAAEIDAREVLAMDRRGEIKRNLHKAPLKDTVSIPDGGYTIVRFHANNPGVWFLHCHIEYHVEIGMGVLIQVGEESQFPPVPPRFPTCGDWDPNEAVAQEAGDKMKSSKGSAAALSSNILVPAVLLLLLTQSKWIMRFV